MLTRRSTEEMVDCMLFKQALIFLKEYKSGIQDCGIKTLEVVLGKLINCEIVMSSYFLNLKVTLKFS